MGYGDFKDLNRKTAADKVFREKAFKIAKIPKYDGYQSGIVSIVHLVEPLRLHGRRP